MTYGEVIDTLYGYEARQAKANHRARRIMQAFVDEDYRKFWPIFTDDEIEEEPDFEADGDQEEEVDDLQAERMGVEMFALAWGAKREE